MLVGTVLSPYMFDAISYYGCYGLAITLSGLVSAYFLFVIKEIPKPVDNNEMEMTVPKYSNNKSVNGDNDSDYTIDKAHPQSSCCDNFLFIVTNYIGLPIYEMVKVPFKKRQQNLRALLLIIIGTYALFWFAVEEMLMQYNYLMQSFIAIGFDGEDMSWFSTINYLLSKYCFFGFKF